MSSVNELNQHIADFSNIALRYEAHAFIEQEIGQRLLEKIYALPFVPTTILDLGCGTGQQAALLKQIFPNAHIIGIDVTFAMVDFARNNCLHYVCANALYLPFASQQFDLIVSNCCLPTIIDVNTFLSEATRVLKIGGAFLCSSFGPDSLQELNLKSKTWLDMHILGDLIQTKLNDPVLETEKISFSYPQGQLLAEDLRNTGYTNLPAIAECEPIDITIEAIYAIAWKLQHKQQSDNNGNVYVNIDKIEYIKT